MRAVRDLSGLPRHGFGPTSTTWWGTLGFMTLEGFGFLLAAGAYLGCKFSWQFVQQRPPLVSVQVGGLLASQWVGVARQAQKVAR